MSMEISEVYNLVNFFDKSGLSKLEVEIDGAKVCMEKEIRVVGNTVAVSPAPVVSVHEGSQAPAAKAEASEDSIAIKSPLVGTFYRAASPEEKPYVMVGDTVKKGDVIGIVEAMKLMNEITSVADGVIDSIRVEDGTMVEYDQVLMTIKES